jgi:hypothetical protein
LRTLLDLKGERPGGAKPREALATIPRRGWARDILGLQNPAGNWESKRSLYRPKYTATNWMMLILADLGLTVDTPQVRRAADLFMSEWLGDMKAFIADSEVCVTGNLARMLTRVGMGEDPRVKKLFQWLVDDQKEDGGWHCFDSKVGTLDCWEALAAFSAIPPAKRTRSIQKSIERGAEFYLQRNLFKEGERYEPWFRLHYPVHYYYDLLVGLDTVTSLGYAGDRRLRPALDILKKKRGSDGTWLLEGVHPDPPDFAWGPGNLGRKVHPFALEKVGQPSKWITLTALRVVKRVSEES